MLKIPPFAKPQNVTSKRRKTNPTTNRRAKLGRQWEVLPDDFVYVYFMFPRANGVYGASDYTNYTVDSDGNNRYARFLRSSNNKVYYNPAILYKPWSNSDGSLMPNATPTAAYHNAANHAVGVRDLTVDTNNQSGYWLLDNGFFTGWGTRAYFPATYFKYNGGNVWSALSYTKVEIRPANAPFTKYPDRTDCAARNTGSLPSSRRDTPCAA